MARQSQVQVLEGLGKSDLAEVPDLPSTALGPTVAGVTNVSPGAGFVGGLAFVFLAVLLASAGREKGKGRGKKGRLSGLGADHWLNDPRLPDRDEGSDRVYGDKRPKARMPGNSRVVASRVIPGRKGRAPMRLRVESDRKGRRFWFIAQVGSKPAKADPMAHFPAHRPDEHGYVYSMMSDYDSTTSAKKAQGWIDAINAAKGK